MRSSASLAAAAAALLALSVGLKTALALSAPPPAAAPPSREEQLRRFLAAHAGPIQPTPDGAGWRMASGACEWLAFPSTKRGSLDMGPRSAARRRDRIAYVYRGRVTEGPPTLPLALDVIAYMAAKPFRPGAAEPGYVVLIARRPCQAFPNLPWRDLPIS